jgi:hypothetical protein
MGFDFGMACAFVRPWWRKHGAPYMLGELDRQKEKDTQVRAAAMEGDLVRRDTPPRRLWDLVSNRVIPYWMADLAEGFCAVSHSWIEEDRRHDLLTSVNNYQWPVPIPSSTSLARIRIELLNTLRYGYVWLDVLCLRQPTSSDEDEATRLEEWRLDVPTIGYVYSQARRVCYYMSGLGLPFSLGDLNSKRHWINRAWTFQETVQSDKRIICGLLDDPSPSLSAASKTRNYASVNQFWNQVDRISRAANSDIFPLLHAIISRSSTNEVDKIAALAHLVIKERDLVPAYKTEDPEKAWRRLLNAMDPARLDQLNLMSLTFPFQTKGEYPTWKELGNMALPRCRNWLDLHAASEDVDCLIFNGWNIQWNESLPNQGRRQGLLTLPDGRDFQVDAQEIIYLDNGTYTAALPIYFDLQPDPATKTVTYITNFVIGHFDDGNCFAQVAVVEVIGGLLIDTNESGDWLLGKSAKRKSQVLGGGMYAGLTSSTRDEGVDADRLIYPHCTTKSLRFKRTSPKPPPSATQALWTFLLTLLLSFAV